MRWLRKILEARDTHTRVTKFTLNLCCGDNVLSNAQQTAFREDVLAVLHCCKIIVLALTTSEGTDIRHVLGDEAVCDFCEDLGHIPLQTLSVIGGFFQGLCLQGLLHGLSDCQNTKTLQVLGRQAHQFSIALDAVLNTRYTGCFFYRGPVPEDSYQNLILKWIRCPLRGIGLQNMERENSLPLELNGLSETIQSNMQLHTLDFRATFMTQTVLSDFLAGCANHPTLQTIGLPNIDEEGVDTVVKFLPSLACASMRLGANSICFFDDGKYSRHRLPVNNAVCLDMIIRVLPSLLFSKITFISSSFSVALGSSRADDLAPAIRRQTTLCHLNFEFFDAPQRPKELPRNITELLERNQALAGVQPFGSHTVASLGRAFGKLASMSSSDSKLSPMFELFRSSYVPKVLEE